jgi:hyperosmotically inducible protein
MGIRYRLPLARPILFVVALAAMLSAPILAGSQSIPNRGDANYEKWLAKEVRHQLVLLPFYSVFDNLQYQVNGTNVTLSGQVHIPTLKTDAENAVKGIEGVGKVTNNIEVLPVSPMDEQIRRAEYRAIYGSPALEKYAFGPVPPIHIIVKSGHVTLEGVVDSEMDKNLAGIQANHVPGVFSVMNNLRVVAGS